jgi:hypothetical protein
LQLRREAKMLRRMPIVGISLRKLIGPRLKVGLLRSPASQQTAGPTISFRR